MEKTVQRTSNALDGITRIPSRLIEKLMLLFKDSGMSFQSYSDLDCPINNWAFSADGGRLGTIIQIKGLRKYPMSNQYINLLDQLAVDLSSFLRHEKHSLQFTYTFDSNHSSVERRLKELYSRSYKSMEATGLDLKDILDADIQKMAAQYGVVTDLVVCVWTKPVGKTTSPTTIFPHESNESAKGVYSTSVLDSHMAITHKLITVLNLLDIDAHLLNLSDALAGVRKRANPTVNSKWSPDTEVLSRMPVAKNNGDEVHILPDKLSRQVTPGFIDVPSFEELHIQDKVMIKSYDALHFARMPETFESMLVRIASDDAPVRMTFTITGGAERLKKFRTNQTLASFASKSAGKSAAKYLASCKEGGRVIVGLQMTASTWVNVPEGISNAKKDPKRYRELTELLNRNFEKVVTSFENWGESQAFLKNDTPLYCWARNNAGFRSESQAHMSFAPIEDAFRFLPLLKMSPIWTKYAIKVMRTPQNELIPVNRMAPNQSYSFSIIFGQMRSGKSVYLGDCIRSILTFPNISELPYISFIDVGKTSFGTMDMVRDALPENKKNQVVTYVFKNDRENAINPFHLPMGMRVPRSEKRDFLASFLKLLITDEVEGVREGTEGVIAHLLDSTYRKFNDLVDNSDAKVYHPGENKTLDRWLEEINYQSSDSTTFWDLFDYFFEQGDYHKAHICQAHASPTLTDFSGVIDSPDFLAAYSKEKDADRLRLCNTIKNQIYDAQKNYPILTNYSMLNLDEARALAVDLGEVTPAGTQSPKTTAVMYNIAIDLSVRNFFITEDSIAEIPEKYRHYHQARYNKTKSLPKALYVDELHKATGRNSNSPIAKQTMQIIEDYVRVFSKNFIEFAVATQMLSDITPSLLNLANIKVILSTSTSGEDEIIEKFKLDPSMAVVLRRLGNPSKAGSLMLVQNSTDNGDYTHVLYNTVSAESIWAQVSNKIDILVRDGSYKYLPRPVARKALAIRFPGCSAKADAMDKGGDLDDMSLEKQAEVSDALVAEVVEIGKALLTA